MRNLEKDRQEREMERSGRVKSILFLSGKWKWEIKYSRIEI